MRPITYRQKLRIKQALKILLIVLAVVLCLFILFLLFVERFVVYTDNGVTIDYSRSAEKLEPSPDTPDATTPSIDVEILYESAAPSVDSSGQLQGYYLTAEQLAEADTLLDGMDSLEYGTTVMLELKDPFGYFYYNTAISGAETADVDTAAVERLISALKQRGCSLIAMIPAFSDYSFALANQSCGLPLSNGALWMNMDEGGCYWLDPANETVTAYLEQIARELSSKGFSEVVFEDFYFPSSQNILYHSDKTHTQIIADAAQEITDFFSGSNLIISFATASSEFPTEHLAGRLYLEDVDAAQVERFVEAYGADIENTLSRLVFITNSKDSRFDSYSTMRPLA